MRRSFEFLSFVAASCFLLHSSSSIQAQTKPRGTTPLENRAEARALVNSLLAQGKIMRPSEVKRGMKGYALSVFQGTKIERFPVEVLGNLQKVMGGGDLVLIKVTGGPVVTRQSGIIQGMSGSPVYFNGKMLGAIAIGFGFPKEPIGGVTPITQMIETALPDNRPKALPVKVAKDVEYRPSEPLKVAGRDVSRVVVSSDPTRVALAGDTMTMRPCTQYVELAGVSESSLPRWRKLLAPMNVTPILGGGQMSPAQFKQVFGMPSQKMGVVAPFVPGAAIGVQLVSGDLDMTGVGTVTFRDGKRVLAFGHPMFGLGSVSMPMTTAYVHDIFPAYDISFKLASPIATVGALQQDTAYAIGGTVGKQADTVPMQVFVRDDAQHIRKNYRVRLIKDALYTPQLVIGVAAEAISNTLGGESDKMVSLGLKVQLANGPTIYRRNLVYASDQVLMGGISDLMDALSLTQLNSFEKGDLKSVDVSVQVQDVRRTARIRRIYADRNRVKAGESVHIAVELEPHGSKGETFTKRFEIPTDKDAPNSVLRVVAAPAAAYWIARSRAGGAPPQVQSLRELLQAYSRIGAANELSIQSSTPQNFIMVDRVKVPNPPATWARLTPPGASTSITAYNEVTEQRQTLDYALAGVASISIPVESLRDSDRKRPESPAADPSGGAAPPAPAVVAEVPSASDVDEGDNGGGADDTSVWVDTGDWTNNFGFEASDKDVLPTLQERSIRLRRQVAKAIAAQVGAIKPAIVPVPAPAPSPAPGATPGPTPVPTPTADPTAAGIARPVGRWIQQSAADFSRGTLAGTVVTDDGRVIVGAPWQRVASTAEPVAWSVARDSAGNTYLGTGNRARLFKVAPDGTLSTLYDGPEVAVEALAVDSQNNVYAGVSPGGRVLRFKPGAEKPDVILQTEDIFVHALALDDQGNLFAATGGGKGAIYKVPAAATATRSVLAPPVTVAQDHILAMTLSGDSIYAGTGDEAVLYRIDAKTGVTSALYQVVPSAVPNPGGPPNPGGLDGGMQNPVLTGGGAGSGNTTVLLMTADGRMLDMGQIALGGGNGITGVAVAGNAVYFATAGSGTVYRWTIERGVEDLFRTPGRSVFALKNTSNGLLAAVGNATGNRGQLWEIHPAALVPETRGLLLLEAPQLQVSALGDGVAATANNAAIYSTAPPAAPAFTSNVFDAGQLVRWGALRVSGDNGPVAVTFSSRSGNTREPDSTWSPWSAVSTSDGAMVSAPAGRYLQYRVTFDGGKTQTDVSRVEVLYRAPNRAPTVRWTAPAGGEFISGKKNIAWNAMDPDKDALRFRVTLTREGGETKPVELKSSASANFELDTSKYPDGAYRLQVQASDAARNPEEPLQDSARSEIFTIDNTAPTLMEPTGVKGDDGWTLTLSATDALSPIAGAEWRVVLPEPKKEAKPAPASTPAPEKTDGADTPPTPPVLVAPKPAVPPAPKPEWQAAAAQDGIFDSRSEGIVAKLDPALMFTPGIKLESGTRIEIRVRDTAGNSATIMTTLP